MSFKKGISIQLDHINAKLGDDSSVATGLKSWQIFPPTSSSSEVSASGNHILVSAFQSQAAYPHESLWNQAQRNIHLFNENWQEQVHLPRHFGKVRVKRSPGLGSSISGIGRDVGRVPKGSDHAEAISDLLKPSDFAESSKVLRGDKNPRFDRAESFHTGAFQEDSRLGPVQTLSRSNSVPILSSKEAQRYDRLSILEGLDLHYKPFSKLTDDVMRKKPDIDFIYKDFGKDVQGGIKKPQAALKTEQRYLTFTAYLALYSEKRLFQSAIDGKGYAEIKPLASKLEQQRSIYVNELERHMQMEDWVEYKRFLDDEYIQNLQKQVSSLRNSIWAYDTIPANIKNVKTNPNQAKRVWFQESLADAMGRQKASKEIMQKSLADITADAYLNIRKPRSSIVLEAPQDVTLEEVKELANEAQDTMLNLKSHSKIPEKEATRQAREARQRFKLYIEAYAQEHGIVNFDLFIDVQKISNRREIRKRPEIRQPPQIQNPSHLQHPSQIQQPPIQKLSPKSMLLIWYNKLKDKIKKLLSRFKLAFKRKKEQKVSSSVSPEPFDSPQIVQNRPSSLN